MRRYLDSASVETNLRLGKRIEVFLGRITEDVEIISYLELAREESGAIRVTLYEHFDEGNLDSLDLYDFSYANPDENHEVQLFSTLKEVEEHIQDRYNIAIANYVNAGVIQDEYSDLLKAEGRL